jgi:hypothetical protein
MLQVHGANVLVNKYQPAILQETIEELEAAAGSSGPSEEAAAEVARLKDEVAAAAARADEAEARAKTLAQEKESFGKRFAFTVHDEKRYIPSEACLLHLILV